MKKPSARLLIIPLLPSAVVIAGLLQQPPLEGKSHRFERLADGVYDAMASGTISTGSNSGVIVNEDDVVIIDSHITPASARALIEDIKIVTPKPVRYVIDSHYHYDHSDGNQIFGSDVQLIGHAYVRQMLLTNVLDQYTFKDQFLPRIPRNIQDLKNQIASAKDTAQRQTLERQLRAEINLLEEVKEIKVTPPNVTYDNRMALYRGNREIQLYFLGRAHTGGDTIVHLPKERIIFTGDMLSTNPSYMGDAFLNEWPETLEKVLKLDFDTIVPAHGPPFADKGRIRAYQAYLRDVWTQSVEFRKQGLPPEEAAKKVDLTKHKVTYPQITGPGVDPAAVRRVYDLLDGRTMPR